MKRKTVKTVSIMCIILMLASIFPQQAWALLPTLIDPISTDDVMVFDMYYDNIIIDKYGAHGRTAKGGVFVHDYSTQHKYVIENSGNAGNALKKGYNLNIDAEAYCKAFGEYPTVYLRNESEKPLYIYTGDGGSNPCVKFEAPINIQSGYVNLVVQCDTYLYGATKDSAGTPAISLADDAYLNLTLEQSLTATGGANSVAIGASPNYDGVTTFSSGQKLEINADVSNGSVYLNANAGAAKNSGAPAIGAGNGELMDFIYIHDPKYSETAVQNGNRFYINAIATGRGAGIGSDTNNETFSKRSGVNFIRIGDSPDNYNFLSVKAYGGYGAAGIGAGYTAYKSVIEINNGDILAQGGKGGAGIGGGMNSVKNSTYQLGYYARKGYMPPAKLSNGGLEAIRGQNAEIEIHGGNITAFTETGYDSAAIGTGYDEKLDSAVGNIINTDFADCFKPSTSISGPLVTIVDFDGAKHTTINDYLLDVSYQTSIIIDSKETSNSTGYYSLSSTRESRPITHVEANGALGGTDHSTAYIEVNGGSVVAGRGSGYVGGGDSVPCNSGSYIYLKDGFLSGYVNRYYANENTYTKFVVDGGSTATDFSGRLQLFNSKGDKVYCTEMPSLEVSKQTGKLCGYARSGTGFNDDYLTFSNGYNYTLKSTPAQKNTATNANGEDYNTYSYNIWLPQGEYDAACSNLEGYTFYSDVKADKDSYGRYITNYMKIKTEPITSHNDSGTDYTVTNDKYNIATNSFGSKEYPLSKLIDEASALSDDEIANTYEITSSDENVIKVNNGKITACAYGTATVTIRDKSQEGFGGTDVNSFYNERKLSFCVNVTKPQLGGTVSFIYNHTDSGTASITANCSKVTYFGADSVELKVDWYDSSNKFICTGATFDCTKYGNSGENFTAVVSDALGNAQGTVKVSAEAPLIGLKQYYYYHDMTTDDFNIDISGNLEKGGKLDTNISFVPKEVSRAIRNEVIYMVEYQDETDISKWIEQYKISNLYESYDNNKYSYNISDDLIGKNIRLKIYNNCKYFVGNGLTYVYYTGTFIYPLGVVQKPQGEMPSKPVLDSRTENSITFVHQEGCEYSLDLSKWSSSDTIENLDSSTVYQIYYRNAATASNGASTAGLVSVSTNQVQKMPVPTAKLHLETNTVECLTGTALVSFDKGENWQAADGDSMAIENTLAKGDTVLVKNAGDNGLSHFDSDKQTLTVSSMENPQIKVEYPNENEDFGYVKGLLNTTQYRQKGTQDWSICYDSTLKLERGDWELRYGARGEKLASDIIDITIKTAGNDVSLSSIEINDNSAITTLTASQLTDDAFDGGLDYYLSKTIDDAANITIVPTATAGTAATVGKTVIVNNDGKWYASFTVTAEDNKTSKTYIINIHAPKVQTITAIGNGSGTWLNGANWDTANTANDLTQISPGVWQITYKNIEEFNDYQVKFACNHDLIYNWTSDGVFDGQSNPSNAVTEKGSSVRLTIDVNEFDFDTKTGSVSTSFEVIPPEIITLPGDVDGNGIISITDVIKIQKGIVRLSQLTPEQAAAADVNGDGKVSTADVIMIKKYIAKLIQL